MWCLLVWQTITKCVEISTYVIVVVCQYICNFNQLHWHTQCKLSVKLARQSFGFSRMQTCESKGCQLPACYNVLVQVALPKMIFQIKANLSSFVIHLICFHSNQYISIQFIYTFSFFRGRSLKQPKSHNKSQTKSKH